MGLFRHFPLAHIFHKHHHHDDTTTSDTSTGINTSLIDMFNDLSDDNKNILKLVAMGIGGILALFLLLDVIKLIF